MTRIFCAIDTDNLDAAIDLSKQVSLAGCGIKLGLEFFVSHGPSGVRSIQKACPDIPVFLDLKFHDIPNTVSGALKAAVHLGVAYTNVHAAGGLDMLRLAQDTVQNEAQRLGYAAPKLLAVTVLTSLNDENLSRVGQQGPVKDQVIRLGTLTRDCGLAGVVCSAQEIQDLRTALGNDFVLMVPGIRPSGAETGDQKRIMTPEQAIKLGATHLVIGRPITGASDPKAAACSIMESITSL